MNSTNQNTNYIVHTPGTLYLVTSKLPTLKFISLKNRFNPGPRKIKLIIHCRISGKYTILIFLSHILTICKNIISVSNYVF